MHHTVHLVENTRSNRGSAASRVGDLGMCILHLLTLAFDLMLMDRWRWTRKRYVKIPKEQLPRAKEITPGSNGPTVAKLESGEDGVERVSITVMVNTKEVSEVMDQLEDIGATGLVVLDVTNCRV